MATKLNCFDSGKESRCRESVSRKSYDTFAQTIGKSKPVGSLDPAGFFFA
jgi:hypothetical protein